MRAILHFGFGSGALLLFSLSAAFSRSQTSAGPLDAAANAPVTTLVRRFEQRYRNSATLAATFLERYFENGRVVRAEAGEAYFLRPGKMRWEYQSPEKNLFLVDGKNAWFYVPADHTVTRVPAKDSADWRTPLALLAGEMKVSRVCARLQPAVNETPETPENVVLDCHLLMSKAGPRDAKSREAPARAQTDGDGGAVSFEVASKTGDLVRLVIRDPAGVAVEFHFKNWQFDPPLEHSLFRFHVPPGVAIVNGELPEGQNTLNP